MDRLAGQVQQQLLDRPLERGGVSLVVDGVPVSLGPFASTALAGVILGFVRALKGVPQNPQEVHVALQSANSCSSPPDALPTPPLSTVAL
jgi:hypothetical protein